MTKDKTPIFEPVSHTYTDPAEKFLYTSVTRWIEQYKEPFDEQGAAERVANRECVPVEMILQEWEEIREKSKVFGTRVHKLLEIYHKTKKNSDKEFSVILDGFKKLKITFGKNTFFEKLVFNRKLRIAGTSDVITHNDDGKTFDVYDFKTNKNLRYSSDYEELLLAPIDHLPACEYFTYALQLSMYAYLYKQMSGLEPRRLKILWYSRVNTKNYTDLSGEWVVISVPYLEEEIKLCLEYDKKKVVA